MEELIRQRVNEILLSHNISINKFSDGDSALQNRLSRQINRGASITAETLFILLDKFKDVSAEWLLRGEGIMTKNDSENINDNFQTSTPEQNGDPLCSYQTNLIHMNIDDTLFKALADLKIAGQIQKENLLNNLGVESNMKLYSHAKTGKLDNLRPPNDSFLKLIICTGDETSKEYFNLKDYNRLKHSK